MEANQPTERCVFCGKLAFGVRTLAGLICYSCDGEIKRRPSRTVIEIMDGKLPPDFRMRGTSK
jgi:hypothetical protein